VEGKPKATGAVYVLSNEAMEGYIKIGRTDTPTVESVAQRVRNLDDTNMPLPFNCEHASAVEDALTVEKALHEAFGDYRVRPRREFFYNLAPFRVIAILKLIEIEDVTPSSEQADATEDGTIKVLPRRPSFRFAAVGIPNGATLQWADDPTIVCQVDGDTTYVIYEGQRWAISPLAQKLKGWKRMPSGTPYWLYEDETLRERQLRLEQEATEGGEG
jgi:hypothetical protein